MDEELKDISDAYERRKAQNRIAQRRRRQRLRQDAKQVGVDITEMTGLELSNSNLLGPENDFVCSLSTGWNHDSALETEASLMDLGFLESTEVKEFNGLHGVNECLPKATADQSLSKRLGQNMSDHCRRCSSQTLRPTVVSPLDDAFGGSHQAKSNDIVERAYERSNRPRDIQKPQAGRSNSGSQSLDATYFPSMDGIAAGVSGTESPQSSRNGSPINTISKRTRSESHVQQRQHRRPGASIQRLSSTLSYQSSSPSDAGNWTRDDWESQRSPIASTLTQRSKKLATDLIRLYELGVYLDIQSKDTELEELLSEVRRKFAVLPGNAEKSTRLTNDPTNGWARGDPVFGEG